MLKQTPKKRVLFVRRSSLLLLAFIGVFSYLLVNLRTPEIAHAAAANTVNFQARLQSSAGAIVPDGNYNVEFKLYSASSGGSALWTEDYLNTAGHGLNTINGYLSANLGSITAFPSTINWDQQLWLTMNIGGTSTSGTPTWDGEMNPRLPLTAVPYAFQANQLGSYNNTTGYNSNLSFQGATGGDQNFVIQDQGAAGTYNLLTTNQANANFVQLQNVAVGSTITQTGNLNISGAVLAGTLQASTGGIVDQGTLTFTGGGTTSYVTPGGASIDTKINITNYNPTDYSQVLALGITESSPSTSRVISVFDRRTGTHQPSIALISPDENQIFGLAWEGSAMSSGSVTSNGTATILTTSGTIALQANGLQALTATNSSGSAIVNVAGSLQAGSSSQFQVDGSGNLSTTGQSILGGGSNQAQVIIKANSGQSASNPLLVLKDSTGSELARITSDNYSNLFIGNAAGSSSNGGTNYNTFIGSGSGALTTSGRFNSGLGYNTLSTNTTGQNNTAFGSSALQNADSGYNSAFGSNAGKNLTSGYDNTAFGADSLYSVTNGNNNTAIGAAAGSSDYNGNFATTSNVQNSTVIGAFAQVQQNNSIVLGSVDLATKIGIGTTEPLNTFSVSPLYYATGTASQSGNTVTGTGTSWTSDMVGMQFIFADGDNGTITGVTSATSLTLSSSQTEASQAYRIHTVGFQVTSSGSAYVQTTSTTAFQIQSASGVSLFTADTSTGTLTFGSGSNTVVFTAAGGLVASGTAQHTKQIALTAEYAGAVFDASNDSSCSSANNGNMTSGYDLTNRANYYNWSSTQSTKQCYDVVVQVPLPADFGGWAANPINYNVYSTSTAANTINVELRDTTGTVDSSANFADITPASASTWTTVTGSTPSGTYTAGGYLTLRIRLSSASSSNVRIGNITLNYTSKF